MGYSNQDPGCCCTPTPTPTGTPCVTAGCPPTATLTATLSDPNGSIPSCVFETTTLTYSGGVWSGGAWTGNDPFICNPFYNNNSYEITIQCLSGQLQIILSIGGSAAFQLIGCGSGAGACFFSSSLSCSPFLAVLGLGPSQPLQTLTITP
jgi:hypothetical protein